MRSPSGSGTDGCGRTSATSRPSTTPSPLSTRPSGSRGRRSSAFVREDSAAGQRPSFLTPIPHARSQVPCGKPVRTRRPSCEYPPRRHDQTGFPEQLKETKLVVNHRGVLLPQPRHRGHQGHDAEGRHRRHPVQAPSQLHDLTVARDTGVIGPLNWAASQSTCPPWPTPATTAQARASRDRSSSPPTSRPSLPTTRPTTPCCARPAASANAASPCSPAAGEPSDASPIAGLIAGLIALLSDDRKRVNPTMIVT